MDRELKILLVEAAKSDRKTVARLLRKIFGKIGVDEAADQTAGMKALERNHYNCAIIDDALPDGEVAEFVGQVKHAIHRPPPIVVLTGKSDRDTDLKVMEAGAAECLEKEDLDQIRLDRAVRYAMQHHRLIEQLQESNEKLRELDELKTEFLSTASHELRTPLTIIREFVSLMRDGITGPITEEQKECLDSALSNCDRLGNILNDLLDLQRIESGRARMLRKREDPADIVQACSRNFQLQCDAKGQRLVVDTEENLPEVLCDREKIDQVLVNLVGNAHKFTDAGGVIRVRAQAGPDAVRIHVEDEGPGIKAADQEKIFDRFTQINRHAGPGTRGTGLGLAICKKIMALHQGTITVDSELGRGSRFTITLPVFNEKRELQAFIRDRVEESGARRRSWLLFFLKASVKGASQREEISLLEQARILMQGRIDRDKDGMLQMNENRLLAVMLSSGEEGSWALMREMADELTTRMNQRAGFYFAVQPISPQADEPCDLDPRNLEFRPLYGEERKVLIPAERDRE